MMWEISEVPPYISIKLKDIFRGIARTAKMPYYLPHTDEMCCDLEWFTHRYPMEITDNDLSILKMCKKEFESFTTLNLEILNNDYVSPIKLNLNKDQKLLQYQNTFVDLAWRVKRILCADEVGLGKTPEAIGALLNKGWLPALIVVQTHLPQQWGDEIKKFTDLSYHIINTGKVYDLPRADVYITKYTIMAKWVDVLSSMGFKTLIMDEVQEIRRTESEKHQACARMGEIVENCLGLSGTPVVNYGNEIWNLYKVIKPDLFPDKDTFSREWLTNGVKVSNPKAMGVYLRDKFSYIRRTKEDVGSQIPPINKITHTVDYNKKDIDKMESEARVLALTVMQGSFIEKGQASRELSIMVRKATGISKARSVADYVEVLLKNKEKVLLMGWHRDVYDIWKERFEGYNYVMFTGSETQVQKQKSKEEFINGEAQLMIMSLRAGSAGLDGLQHVCSYIVFGELDWSGVLHDQAIGRLYRKGQKKQVTAIFLTSNSGSDPIVADIIGLKRDQQQGILDPFAQGQKQLSDDSILKKFAKNLINKKG